MGTYRAPGQIIDKSLQEANKQLAWNINKYDTLFAKRKEEQRLQIEKNEKLQAEQDLLRANSYKEWQNELRRTRIPGGYQDHVTAWLRELGDEYYSLSGKTDQASLKRIGELMSIPQQLAEGQGAMQAISAKYGNSLEYAPGTANSLNKNTTSHDNLAFVTSYYNKEQKILPGEIDGQVSWHLGGKVLNNNAFVTGALEGNQFLRYNGDIDSIVSLTAAAAKTEMDYDKGGVEVAIKNRPNQSAYIDNTAINDKYKNKMWNFDYKDIMNNTRTMESIFSQTVDLVAKAAKRDGPTSKAAILLYGADGLPGGEDIDPSYADADIYNANGQVGPWVGSNSNFGYIAKIQKEIAHYGLYEKAISDKYMKDDRVDVSRTYTYPQQRQSGYTPSADERIIIKAKKSAVNEELYKKNSLLANKIASQYNKIGDHSISKRTANEMLAKQLNIINTEHNTSQKGGKKAKYQVGTDEGVSKIYLNYAGDDELQEVFVDLEDASAISQLLTIDGGGMNQEVYEYFQNLHLDDDFVWKDGKYIRMGWKESLTQVDLDAIEACKADPKCSSYVTEAGKELSVGK